MATSLTIQAPAKLNLALSVGPRDERGMHPICSWMVTVNLCDDLTLTRLSPGSLSRYAILWHKDARRRSEINWSVSNDLAVRAHLALQQRVGRDLPVQMKLEKRIPVGGGLGGGSSDAAAMLRGVNDLFDLGLSLDELATIGASLGSDVSFLVRGGSAIVEGLGDRLTPHPPGSVPPMHAVLAFPEAACPTGRVYGVFDELGNATVRSHDVSRLACNGPIASDAPFNDLAAAAMRVAPRLAENLEALSRIAQRPAHITGSGSTLFVICDDPMHALALADAVERKLSLPSVYVRSLEVTSEVSNAL